MFKFFNAVNVYFHRLSLENWGFPWHIILAYWGGRLGNRISDLNGWDLSPVVIASAVMLVGFVYEWIQSRRMDATAREITQDILANTIGVLAYLTF